ncbi:mite allergen Der p 7 [Anabrus simplex]|uniref:mite allergen Der p 7 n=1 Tax=Anabrus simplex TaxID=316456 RepID=UPI0035A3671D
MENFILAFLAVSLLLWTAQCSNVERRDNSNDGHKKANINDYFDRLVPNLQDALVKGGYDPMKMPDTKLSFAFTDLLGIQYPVDLGFENGRLEYLSHLKRDGEATLQYKDGSIDISVPLIFNSLEVYYDLVAKFMHVGPKAHVKAIVNNLEVSVELDVNLNEQNVTLKDLRLKEASDIKVRVKGLSILNPVIDIIGDFFASYFKRIILKAAEARVREEVAKTISSIDIFNFLPH